MAVFSNHWFGPLYSINNVYFNRLVYVWLTITEFKRTQKDPIPKHIVTIELH